MTDIELIRLLDKLVECPQEMEWLEFKLNFHSPEEIGERISALSNSACLLNRPFGYLIFGVEDGSHEIKGTNFRARSQKRGNEELTMWLTIRLNPKIDFEVYEFDYKSNVHISMYKIPATINMSVKYNQVSYIRIGSLTKKLQDFPEKESKIWNNNRQKQLNKIIVKHEQSVSEILTLLSVETYFDLMKLPLPQSPQGIIERFLCEGIIVTEMRGYGITELGAILFAKDLNNFDNLQRKAIRVIVYKGKNKIETIREQIGFKGYAVGFVGLIDWINGQLPANEEIGKALRKDVRMYPTVSIRELVANCIIHQDFSESGFPMVEIYSDRIEISNPGVPLIDSERFIDEYKSRNEMLADLMRRMGICEEKGSGMDKVIFNNELYQLPALNILVQQNRTVVTMYAYKTLRNIDKMEKIQACYQHACLKYVSNEKMTNQSLRDRFKISDSNYSMASRIIKDTLESKKIKEVDPESHSKKYASYIPYWA